ncbi:MAG: acetylxylan esterase [Planctomycetes bacterium]|nr:acetylxylan esterase [Planctomycetota bacterium]
MRTPSLTVTLNIPFARTLLTLPALLNLPNLLTLLTLLVLPALVPGRFAARLLAGDLVEAALATPLLERGQADRELEAMVLSRVPRLEAPPSGEEWSLRAADLRRRVLERVVFRGWPRELVERKAQARFVEGGTIETGKGYRIRKLHYEPYPGMWLPALVYEPEKVAGGAGAKAPAILHVNGHVGAPGKAVDYKQILSANLAKRGMVVLSPEWFSCGELSDPAYWHNGLAWIDLCGRSGVGLFYLALRGGLDVLLEHPAADPERVAVTGLSGGGWQTIVISALDERVKACAPNAGYCGLPERVEHPGSIGDLEQNPADLLLEADYTHLTAMLVPRPALLIYNRRDDCCFPSALARRSVYDPALPFFRRFAPWAELSFHENANPGDHNYGLDNRQAFYRFLNRLWAEPREGIDDEIPCPGEVRSTDELRVGIPEGNATFRSIALELARGLPARKAAELEREEALRARAREALREVLRVPAEKVARAEASAANGARGFRLRLERGLTLPASDLGPADAGATIVLCDGGRKEAAEAVREALKAGRRALAVDLLLLGEARPARLSPWHFTMLLSNVGVRPLAEAAAEVLAVARWARSELGAKDVRVDARGPVAATTALVAAALDGGEAAGVLSRVKAAGAPESLKALIEPGSSVERAPQLFPFGLLEAADLPELRALARPGVLE